MNRLQHLVLCTSVIASTSCGVSSDDGSPVEVGTTTQEVRTRVHNSVMKDSSASMFIDTPTSFAYLDVWRTGRNAADLSYEVREVDISVEVCETYTYWDCPYPPPGCDPGAGGQGGYGGFPVGGSAGASTGGSGGSPGAGGVAGGPGDDPECCWPGEPGCCTIEECCIEREESYCFHPLSTVEYGYGTIPPNAFQTQGRVARLAVTVAPGPEFTISRCTEDWYHGVYDCSDSVGGGSISLTWIPSNGYSTFRRGVEEFGVGFVT